MAVGGKYNLAGSLSTGYAFLNIQMIKVFRVIVKRYRQMVLLFPTDVGGLLHQLDVKMQHLVSIWVMVGIFLFYVTKRCCT